MPKFTFVQAAITGQPWAMMPDRIEAMIDVVERRMEGVRLSAPEIEAIKGHRQPNGVMCLFDAETIEPVSALVPSAGPSGSAPVGSSMIAVINVMGIIAQHAAQVDDISGSGGTSTDRVSNSFRSALNDPAVKAIVFNIDSPGGNVNGVQSLSDEIFKARGQKPIIAQVNSLAASAAYWIASSADEIVMTPGAQVGSIGVYALHKDVSKANEAKGEKYTFISEGDFKTEGNQHEPLTDEAIAAIQDGVKAYYVDFTSAVARGRGVETKAVIEGFGRGRVEKDKKAIKSGMADRIATLNETLRGLSAKKAGSGMKAEVEHKPTSADLPSPVVVAEGEQQSHTMEKTAEELKAAADNDSFRRRRHAHRMRSL
jgi:capsid assembly protease